MNEENQYQYTPLPEPIPITEQDWPEGTKPMVTTRTMTYMHENYIRECIEGILMQKTTFPVQVLIHDDASTDMTANIVKEYADKYPKLITAYFQKENSYTKSDKIERRKPFFDLIAGKYIALCEGDDYWIDPYKLQKQVGFLEANSDYGLVYTEINCYHQKSRNLEEKAFKNRLGIHDNTFEDFLIHGWFIAPCTWLYRERYNNYKLKNNNLIGDLPLLLNISSKSKIGFLKDVTSTYRVLNKSASSRNDIIKRIKIQFNTLSIRKEYAVQYDIYDKLKYKMNLMLVIQMIKILYFFFPLKKKK
ncbi:glycosyl transferase family 2 [Chloroherpeton thalassium ATCC 35110]|uniref:Glycosyl transferase family 2 n=1 Tax=Chloroherpeton thalassium (strain ATCC 35110 / GB-78) TaxID=517418 RepID=B3QVJ3_CHLT3|nr:glycosyltransferase family 2 protein [Chloroherpeton thalassium]ACF14593.1 glycosyl transferase family 2 [Chloroherpeton thalassium ATCC 35110]